MMTYKITTAAFLAAMLGASVASASAAVTAPQGRVTSSVMGGVGVNAASASISTPQRFSAGAGGGPANANVSGTSATTLGAFMSRSRLTMTGTSRGTMAASATVRNVGAGTLTLSNGSGATMTLNVPQSVLSRLGLQRGNVVAMTRTAHGIMMTNVSYLRRLTGRGTVRNVSARAITFTNATGTHTLAFTRQLASRLHLTAGSQIVVQALGLTRVRIVPMETRVTKH